jgi:hypothetical protein
MKEYKIITSHVIVYESDILLSTADREQAANTFEAAIQAATTAIPLHTITRNQLTLPPALVYLLKLKNDYRRRYQRSRTPTFRYLSHLLTQIFLKNSNN